MVSNFSMLAPILKTVENWKKDYGILTIHSRFDIHKDFDPCKSI